LQQKGIGEMLGKSVGVRSMVMVNSKAIKAFKLICQVRHHETYFVYR
jgi:hypothetical protein